MGLQQAAADLLTMALDDPSKSSEEGKKAYHRLLKRLWKGYQKTVADREEIERINKSFEDYFRSVGEDNPEPNKNL